MLKTCLFGSFVVRLVDLLTSMTSFRHKTPYDRQPGVRKRYYTSSRSLHNSGWPPAATWRPETTARKLHLASTVVVAS